MILSSNQFMLVIYIYYLVYCNICIQLWHMMGQKVYVYLKICLLGEETNNTQEFRIKTSAFSFGLEYEQILM